MSGCRWRDSGNCACLAISVTVPPVGSGGKQVAERLRWHWGSRAASLTCRRRCDLKPLGRVDYVPCVYKLRRVAILRATAFSGVAVALSLTAVPDAHAAVAVTAGAPIRGLDVSAH